MGVKMQNDLEQRLEIIYSEEKMNDVLGIEILYQEIVVEQAHYRTMIESDI